MSFIQTYTGREFYPLAPWPEDVDIVDIAHSLSLLNRFTGHTTEPYSVAQHSLHVAEMLPPKLQLQGLLHDASEAYMADVSSPLKKEPEFAFYRMAEDSLMETIFDKYDLPWPMDHEVKIVDKRMLMTEARDLMGNPSWALYPFAFTVRPLPWRQAKLQFLEKFATLTGNQYVG